MSKKTSHLDAHFMLPVEHPYTMRVIRPVSETNGSITVEASATTRVVGNSLPLAMSKNLTDTSHLKSKTPHGPCFLRFNSTTGEQLDGFGGWRLTPEAVRQLRRQLRIHRGEDSPDTM